MLRVAGIMHPGSHSNCLQSYAHRVFEIEWTFMCVCVCVCVWERDKQTECAFGRKKYVREEVRGGGGGAGEEGKEGGRGWEKVLTL